MTQDDCWAAKYNEVMEENLSLAIISQKDFISRVPTNGLE